MKPRKVIVRVRTKAPTASSPEIPILSVLAKSIDDGVPTRIVIKEVLGCFDRLTDDDRKARYPGSKKKIVETVVKFARKNLVMKDEVFQAGEGGKPIGIWMITPKGVERAASLGANWKPRYAVHDAIIIEEEKR